MTFSTDRALTPSGIDPDISASLQIFDRMRPLKDALGIDKLTDGEMQVFAMVALHTGLDPFTKQIYAIKRGGKVTHQTGIDGYRSTAERTGQYAGSDEATFEPCDCGSDDSPANHPKVARVVVHRVLPNGHVVNQVGKARWHELKPDHRKPNGAYDFLDQMWWKMPENQLAKCAEADGLRKAFPRVLGGVYISDEMQQAETIEGESTEAPARPPTVAERVAARRLAAQSHDAPIPDAAGASSPEPTADPSAPGISGEDFRAAIERAGIPVAAATAKAHELFPGVRNLDDGQRYDLLLALTAPETTTDEEAEIDAALAKV